MKPFSLLAFVAAWGTVMAANLMDGGSPAALFSHPAPLVLIFGGSLAAAAMGSQAADMKQAGVALKLAFLGRKLPDPVETIERMRTLAGVARKDGLMGLESKVSEFDDDPFLKRGVEMILDGLTPEELRDFLEADITAMEDRHRTGAKFFEMAGGYAPTVGIIGTVMGLVHILESLDQPDKLGPAIGSAFLATLWGISAANLIFLPISAKLKRLDAGEVAHRELVVEGLVAIHVGGTPRSVAERLRSQVSVKVREKIGTASS